MKNKHFIPALLLAATLVMAGCNQREIATSSTSKTGLSTSDPTSLPTSVGESTDSLTSVSVESKDSQPVNPSSEVSNTSNPTSGDTGSQDSASSQGGVTSIPSVTSQGSASSASSQEVVPVYVDWYVVGQGAFLNGGPSWGDGGIRMQEMEDALGVAHVTFSVGDKFKVSNKSEVSAKWLGHDVLDKGTAYVDPDGDGNMVLNQAGTYDVVLTNEEHIKLLATGTTPVKEDPIPEVLTHDYYVIGSMADSSWGANKEKYGMNKITSDDKVDYYRSDALELAAGVELKVVDQEKHNDKWFPTNNINITEAGTYYVYYLPSADGVGDVWRDGCVAVTLTTADVPAIPSKTVDPVHENVIHVYGGTTELELDNLVNPEDTQNVAVYEIVGFAGATISLKRDDDVMEIHYNEDPAVSSFEFPYNGKFTFYVNNEYEVYVVGLQALYAAVDMTNEDFYEFAYENPNNADQAIYNIHMEEGRGINFWHIATAAEVRYSYLMSNCNIDLRTDMLSQYFIANQEGDYTFTITKLELGFEVWVDGPQKSYQLSVNGTALNIAPATDLTDDEAANNNAVYRNVHLDKDDALTIKYGVTVLHFYQYNELTGENDDKGTSLTAWASGTLTIYINKSNQVYYGNFQPDPVPHNYSIYGDDVAINHSLKEMTATEANENNAIYEDVHLNEGTVVTIKDNGQLLNFYHWDELANEEVNEGTSFTAHASGKFTFWINKNNKVYHGNFKADPAPVISYNYYLVGAFNNYSLDGAPMFSAMGEESKIDGHTQYMVSEVTLNLDVTEGATNDFKVTGVPDRGQAHVHYPAEGTGHVLTEGGKYNVYFCPEGNSEWAETYFYFAKIEEPAPSYSIIINDQVANLETGPLEGDEANDNNDVYKNVRLEETDIVEIKLGNDNLHFYYHDQEAQLDVDDGTEYMAEADGLYTFWLAKDGKVWVDVIKDVKNTVQYDASLGEWANDNAVIFAHSWKEGYATLTSIVENGKMTLIAECDGFMLVRMPTESTDINWDTLWNKTANLTVGEGTLTFSAWGGEDKISTFEWVEEQHSATTQSVTLSYSGTTGNMDGENQAALLGVDNTVFSVVGTKTNGGTNNVGLNKDGSIRLYAGNLCALTITGLTVKIKSISFGFKDGYSSGLTVSVGGEAIEPVDGVYTLNAETNTNIVLSNSGSNQVRITSITITYEA